MQESQTPFVCVAPASELLLSKKEGNPKITKTDKRNRQRMKRQERRKPETDTYRDIITGKREKISSKITC